MRIPPIVSCGVGFGLLGLCLLTRRRLQERVGGLAATLAETESQRSRRAAERDEAEAFARSLVHELKSPLRSIRGFGSLLKRRQGLPTDLEPLQQAAVMAEAADALDHLVDKLAGLYELDRVLIDPVRVDLEAEARAVVQALDPAGGATIRVHPMPAAWGDEELLRTVLLTLMDNALKFTSRTPQPTVDVGALVRDGHAIYFIRDNGVGFDPRYVDRLFQPFQRLHSRHEFDGSGLGLALVRRILEKHGGSVWAQGTTGEGATVFFTLPEPVTPP